MCVRVPTRTNKHTDMKQKWTTGPVDGLTPFSRTGVHCSDVYDDAVPLAFFFFIVFLFVLSLFPGVEEEDEPRLIAFRVVVCAHARSTVFSLRFYLLFFSFFLVKKKSGRKIQ